MIKATRWFTVLSSATKIRSGCLVAKVLSNLFSAIASGLLGTAPIILSNALNREECLMGLGIWN
jgi:hypothetical protein